MEKIHIVANWKMNPVDKKKARDLFSSVEKIEKGNKEMVICPPFPYLTLSKKVTLGAQNCFFERRGAFTGEVSPLQLKDLGCKYIIIGHSERRRVLKENTRLIKKKLKLLLNIGIIPILCVGEEEGDEIDATNDLKDQIRDGLEDVSLKKIIVAYEPIFAIGTGNPCPTELATKRRLFIKSVLSKMRMGGDKTPVLYGGSVNAKNARQYVHDAGFQGLLVGGSSLKVEEFKKIVESI